MEPWGRRGSQRPINIWPGFVDGLASLLLVTVFVLLMFVIAQFFLSSALTGRDQALEQLQRRVSELTEMLVIERDSGEELRASVAQLSSELQSSQEARERMAVELETLLDRREALESARDEAMAMAEERAEDLRAAYETIEADRERIEAQLDEIAILESLRDELREEVSRLELTLAEQDEALEQARASAAAREAQVDALAGELERAIASLGEEANLRADAQRQIDLLNRQLLSLRRQIGQLNAALEASEAKSAAQEVQIANLGQRLNAALATRVQELARYRSEFFGRLREVLGDREDVRIVGDRFVFQSEVLFDTASAELGPEGREQIVHLADTLKEIIPEIPEDLDWVLRVDGHTDQRPISTFRFPSNWELSSARAIAVVQVLIAEGIPAERLAAAGFGEYQPLESGFSEAAFRRNRRIEFKLTEP